MAAFTGGDVVRAWRLREIDGIRENLHAYSLDCRSKDDDDAVEASTAGNKFSDKEPEPKGHTSAQDENNKRSSKDLTSQYPALAVARYPNAPPLSLSSLTSLQYPLGVNAPSMQLLGSIENGRFRFVSAVCFGCLDINQSCT